MTAARELIATLAGLEPIKTWSLIVTLFGDARDTDIPAKSIRLALDHIGIQPGATRVALHRLKADGWIVARKSGREVTYALSDRGVAETRAAYSDIYSLEDKYPAGWMLQLIGPYATEAPLAAEAVQLSKDLRLIPTGQAEAGSDYLDLPLFPARVPAWLCNQLIDQRQQAMAQRIIEAISAATELEERSRTDGLTIRLLVLHHWRKLALRPASWAHLHLCPDGPIAHMHRAATHFLANTDPIELTGLNEPA